MDILENLLSSLTPFRPLGIVIAVVVIALLAGRRLVRGRTPVAGRTRFREQILSVLIGVAGMLLVVLVLPVADSTRGQLLNLLGLAVTAIIALSSTTVVANAMAGLMIRIMGHTRIGDMIHVGEHAGRVTEFGLFHTEIQNESSELVTLPNLYLVTHPVERVRESGTFITAGVSLGYDVDHKLVETLLLDAARDAKLDKGAVHVYSLHDHAVEYRVYGFTEETGRLYTLRSRLNAGVLDRLHGAGVEIVSPSFMIQRPQTGETRMIPRPTGWTKTPPGPQEAVEDLAFEKASQAERVEKLREEYEKQKSRLKELRDATGKAEGAERTRLDREVTATEQRIARIEALLQQAEQEDEFAGD